MCLPRIARCESFSNAAGDISKALPHAVTTTHSEPPQLNCRGQMFSMCKLISAGSFIRAVSRIKLF